MSARALASMTGVAVVAVGTMALGHVAAGSIDSERVATPSVSPTAGASSATAVAALERATTAASAVAYTGTRVVSRWTSHGSSSSELVRVTNVPGHGQTVSVQGTAAYAGTVSFTAQGDAVPPSVNVALLERNYRLEVGATATVAGRQVDVVRALRADGTVAGVFWIDQQTGLLLRRAVYDANGQAVQDGSFVSVQYASTHALSNQATSPAVSPTPRPTPSASSATPESLAPSAWPTSVDSNGVEQLRDSGCPCPDSLPGGMALVDVRTTGNVVHLSYSDGLSTSSVFVEPGQLAAVTSLAGFTHVKRGSSWVWLSDTASDERLTWSSRGHVFTLVTDAPDATIAATVSALPFDADDEGMLGRIDRGLARITSWISPWH